MTPTPYASGRDWTLYHGDCLEILPTLAAGSIDAVVTDPPYGINFAGRPTKWQRRSGNEPKDWDITCPNIVDVVGLADLVVVWGGNYFGLPPSRGWLAWVKPDAPPSMGNVEFAWTSLDRTAKFIQHSIGATNAERVGHPTQKPLAVMKWTLDLVCPPECTVLDPFTGSGTTGVACLQTGRRFIGIELDEGYCEVAAKRLRRAEEDTAMFAEVERTRMETPNLPGV